MTVGSQLIAIHVRLILSFVLCRLILGGCKIFHSRILLAAHPLAGFLYEHALLYLITSELLFVCSESSASTVLLPHQISDIRANRTIDPSFPPS
ncbi:hypothetical protein R3P38DRAFT_2923711 [Favolaschia claudopus]|uniref:Secreted protein n=1 Tax=Favolaschia claudopus TaxID=2862362 RepID=A0AAW0BX54_9AGAR